MTRTVALTGHFIRHMYSAVHVFIQSYDSNAFRHVVKMVKVQEGGRKVIQLILQIDVVAHHFFS